MTSTLRDLLDRSLRVSVQEFREAVESLFEGVYFDHFHYTNSMEERVKIDRIVLPSSEERNNKDKIYVLLNQLKRVDLTATPTEVIFFIKEELKCDSTCGNFDYNLDYKWREVKPHEDVEEEQMTYMIKYGECGIDKRFGRDSTFTNKFKVVFDKVNNSNWKLSIFVDDKFVHEQFVMSTNVRYAITKGYRILRNVLGYTYFESIQNDYSELRGTA
jgi:hypothetical protein